MTQLHLHFQQDLKNAYNVIETQCIEKRKSHIITRYVRMCDNYWRVLVFVNLSMSKWIHAYLKITYKLPFDQRFLMVYILNMIGILFNENT